MDEKSCAKIRSFFQIGIPIPWKNSPIVPFLQFFSHFCYKRAFPPPFSHLFNPSRHDKIGRFMPCLLHFGCPLDRYNKKVTKKFGAYSKNLYLCTVKIMGTTPDETNIKKPNK